MQDLRHAGLLSESKKTIEKLLTKLFGRCEGPGVRGNHLKECVREAWNAAAKLPAERNPHIVTIGEELQKSGELNDSQIRFLFAQASFTSSPKG